MISAIGSLLAAIGLLVAVSQLSLYKKELRGQVIESERLEWERILKLLHQVAKYGAMANVASTTHSPFLQRVGFVPPDVADTYGRAQENLMSYWHQLRMELSLMPDDPLVDKIQEFINKYDLSADARSSKQFLDDLPPLTHAATARAQKRFGKAG